MSSDHSRDGAVVAVVHEPLGAHDRSPLVLELCGLPRADAEAVAARVARRHRSYDVALDDAPGPPRGEAGPGTPGARPGPLPSAAHFPWPGRIRRTAHRRPAGRPAGAARRGHAHRQRASAGAARGRGHRPGRPRPVRGADPLGVDGPARSHPVHHLLAVRRRARGGAAGVLRLGRRPPPGAARARGPRGRPPRAHRRRLERTAAPRPRPRLRAVPAGPAAGVPARPAARHPHRHRWGWGWRAAGARPGAGDLSPGAARRARGASAGAPVLPLLPRRRCAARRGAAARHP